MKSHIWIAGPDKTLVASFNSENGEMTAPSAIAGALGRGFMCLHPSLDIVYGLSLEDRKTILGSYLIQADGTWELQSQLHTGSENNGTHLMVNSTGTLVAVAHYWGSAVSVMSLAEDGSLKEVVLLGKHEGHSSAHERQKQALPHWAGFSPDGRYLYVPDLGNDQVWVYSVNENEVSLLKKVKLPDGYGPRHAAFHPNGKYLYLGEELACKVAAFDFDADSGDLNLLQQIDSLPEADRKRMNIISEVIVHPNGKWLYAGNRGHDTIGVFSIDQKTGLLTALEYEPVRGSWPRHFVLDPTGEWMLVNGQNTDTIAVFKIDQETGRLVFDHVMTGIPGSNCMLIKEAD